MTARSPIRRPSWNRKPVCKGNRSSSCASARGNGLVRVRVEVVARISQRGAAARDAREPERFEHDVQRPAGTAGGAMHGSLHGTTTATAAGPPTPRPVARPVAPAAAPTRPAERAAAARASREPSAANLLPPAAPGIRSRQSRRGRGGQRNGRRQRHGFRCGRHDLRTRAYLGQTNGRANQNGKPRHMQCGSVHGGGIVPKVARRGQIKTAVNSGRRGEIGRKLALVACAMAAYNPPLIIRL